MAYKYYLKLETNDSSGGCEACVITSNRQMCNEELEHAIESRVDSSDVLARKYGEYFCRAALNQIGNGGEVQIFEVRWATVGTEIGAIEDVEEGVYSNLEYFTGNNPDVGFSDDLYIKYLSERGLPTDKINFDEYHKYLRSLPSPIEIEERVPREKITFRLSEWVE